MEADAFAFVKRLELGPDIRSEHVFERNLLDRDHVDLDLSLAKRRRGFEPDEARADDHGAAARLSSFGNCPRIVAPIGE